MEANWEFVVLGDLKHSLEKCNLELAIIGLVMIIKTNFADGDEFLVVKKLTVCLHELLYLSLGGFWRSGRLVLVRMIAKSKADLGMLSAKSLRL